MALRTSFSHFLAPDNRSTRQQVLTAALHPLFIPRYAVSLPRNQELTNQRLQLISTLGLVSPLDLQTNPTNLFTAVETLALVDLSLATKASIQFNLFGGTLVRLGTERHQEVIRKVATLQAVGGFALTEVGHGNNALGLETTATWESGEFVINSPNVSSHKFWVSNTFLGAQWVIVLAKLIVGGRNEGIHAFLVRIRHENGSILPGVDIESMGMKLGDNGNDLAKLAFSQMRVPREALLNRYSDISPQGVFSSTIAKTSDRFFSAIQQLVFSRICMAGIFMSASKLATVIAIRFSAKRLSTGPTGKSDTPILTYQLQQNALFPLIAKMVCLDITLNYVKGECVKGSKDAPDLGSVLKAMITWHSERLLGISRERMGGQGYLACNRVGPMLGTAHAGITGEGDNVVLMQKVASNLMRKKDEEMPQLKYCPKRQLPEMANVATLELLLELVKAKEVMVVGELKAAVRRRQQASMSFYDIWMKEESDRVQLAARAYGERVCAEQALAALSQRPDLAVFLTPTVTLFLLDLVKNDLAWFLLRGVLSPAAARGVEEEWTQAVKRFGSIVQDLVEAFDIPEELIFAPAAKDLKEFYSKKNYGEHLPLAKL